MLLRDAGTAMGACRLEQKGRAGVPSVFSRMGGSLSCIVYAFFLRSARLLRLAEDDLMVSPNVCRNFLHQSATFKD